MMLRVLAAVLLCLATGAGAGPWPQPEGKGHLCFSIDARTGDGSGVYATAYAEYGIGNDRTLGLDLGRNGDEFDKAVLFLRWPLAEAGDGTLYAYELGIGMADAQAALRPGFSLGRGLSIGNSSGWIALDTRAVLFEADGEGILQSDLTLGAQTPAGHKWMVQLQMSAPSDSSAKLKIAPSFAFRHKEGRHLLVGAAAGLSGTDTVKISVGFWQAF